MAFTHIQHQGSLSSVTSPSANQQPAIHKSGTSGEVDRDWPVVFRCTPAHPLPTHGNLCTQCSSYKPEGSMSVPLSILYLLIMNLIEFLKV